MKKLLLGFGIIYGELTSLVVILVLIQYWVYMPSGLAICGVVGLQPMGCNILLSLIVLASIGTVTIFSFKKLVLSSKDKEDSPSGGKNKRDDSGD